MANFNYNNEYKTLVAKDGIKAGAYVKVSNSGDWSNWCMVTDRKGTEARYEKQELQSMSCVGTSKKSIDEEPNYRDGHYLLPNGLLHLNYDCQKTIYYY